MTTFDFEDGNGPAEVRSDIAALSSKLDSMPTKWTFLGGLFGAAATVLGIALTFFVFGGGAASISLRETIEARDISNKNAERMLEIDQKIDVLLKIVSDIELK